MKQTILQKNINNTNKIVMSAARWPPQRAALSFLTKTHFSLIDILHKNFCRSAPKILRFAQRLFVNSHFAQKIFLFFVQNDY